MANDGEEGRGRHPLLMARARGRELRDDIGEINRAISLDGIEEEGERPKQRRFAGYVGRADVAAAAAADVFAAKDPYQQIAEGDRAQKIAGDRDDEEYAS